MNCPFGHAPLRNMLRPECVHRGFSSCRLKYNYAETALWARYGLLCTTIGRRGIAGCLRLDPRRTHDACRKVPSTTPLKWRAAGAGDNASWIPHGWCDGNERAASWHRLNHSVRVFSSIQAVSTGKRRWRTSARRCPTDGEGVINHSRLRPWLAAIAARLARVIVPQPLVGVGDYRRGAPTDAQQPEARAWRLLGSALSYHPQARRQAKLRALPGRHDVQSATTL